jgi:ADP-ribose pyrophosphatase YjhB (NUDIX family)
MGRDFFRTVLKGSITHDERVDRAMGRETREETGPEVSVETLVDVMTCAWGDSEKDSRQILYHWEADSRPATARGDLQAVQWVAPEGLTDCLFDNEAKGVTERPRQTAFLADLRA